jgi:hypothetical protein
MLLPADYTHNKPKIHVGLYGEKLTLRGLICSNGIATFDAAAAAAAAATSNVFMSSSRRFIHEITVIRIPHPLMHSSIFSNL